MKIFHHQSQNLWDEDLPWLSVAFNTALHESAKCYSVLKIYYSPQCVMKEDEVDGMNEPQKKKKLEKGKRSSEGAECDLMANNVELEETEPVSGTEYKKKKRHFGDGGRTGAEIGGGEATGSEKDVNPSHHI